MYTRGQIALNWLLFVVPVLPFAIIGGRLSDRILQIVASNGVQIPGLWNRYFVACRRLYAIARQEADPTKRSSYQRLLVGFYLCVIWVYAWLILLGHKGGRLTCA